MVKCHVLKAVKHKENIENFNRFPIVSMYFLT